MKLGEQYEPGELRATPELDGESAYVFPVTFAQQRLWFLDQLKPGSVSYLIPWSFRITGNLNVEALERALNEMVRRHEILRTTFSVVDGEPVQVVAKSLRLSLPVDDVSLRSNPEEEARRLATEEAQRPLDLEHGPLVRARLLRLGDADHVLLLTLHHINFDGWSRHILAGDLAVLYEAFRDNKPSPLSELRLQYADYAVWQRRSAQAEDIGKQVAYWKRQLAGAPVTVDLRTDRPRDAMQTSCGQVEAFSLSKTLSDRLRAIAREENATLFMVLLATFGALLSRYSGQEDIVVGTPIANRNRTETEGIIGLFANMLPLRINLSSDSTFRDLVRRTKDVTLDAYAHQDVPFEKLVEELKPERSLNHNPLFQILFSLQNVPRQAFELTGLELSPFETGRDSAKFDISLFLVESPDGLRGRLEYNADLFESATIKRMLRNFQNLLEGAVSRPEQRLCELSLLGEEELQQVLVEWKGTGKEYPRNASISELFESQVARTPDCVALVFEDHQLTYAELNQRANQLAHHLLGVGVRQETLVGICMERSLEMIVAILSVLKAGGAYVPLDPAYPKERLGFMLQDAHVQVLLTQARFRAELPLHQAVEICLDNDWPKIAEQPIENLCPQANADNLAYVMYTSGSTGRPKGVEVPHRAVVRLVLNTNYVSLNPAETLLQLAPISFDASTFEIWGALLNGARLVVFPAHAPTLEELGTAIRENGISTLWLTASLFHEMVESQMDSLLAVRQLLAGGDVLSVPHVRKLLGRMKGGRLINGYGPTENTTFTCCYVMTSSTDIGPSVPIGWPIANTQVYILDKNLQAVPEGAAGELHAGGDGLARGYLNRSELTAERFIANPFSSEAGSRLYKTGDLVRFLPDGNIQYLGRMDQQVKLRGFRIELGEIEATLAQHPGVQACVVVAREDAPGGKRLVAYVVPETRAIPRAEELRQHVKQNLPEFMVPSRIVMLEAFPLTPNGKVDRKALPAPENTRGEGESYVAPKTPVEQGVAAIWSEVLGVPLVGTQDDFFSLGGHSLLVMQVISRLRKKFQIELPLRALFEAPTVAGLGERIEQLQGEEQGLGAPLLKRAGSEANPPLSYAQQRLWFLDQLEPQSAFYNVPYIVRLQGRLRVGVLEKSLDEVVRRHEVLRTRFETVQGEPVQVIDPWRKLAWVIKDLRGLPGEDREAEARRLVVEEAQRPFDLQRGPLLRASLIQLADEDQVLILNIHHIVSDRWSLGVLWEEVAVLYEAAVQGKPSPLEELPVQYADYAIWQREYLSGERLQTQLGYWKQQLEGAPPVLDLPTDRVRPTVESFRGARQSVNLPKELLEGLKELSRQEGVTLFMMMLAAFSVLLSRYSGQEDIVVGSPIAGRNRVEIEKLIGFFVNTLALRTKLSGDPTFRELLGRVREAAVGAYAHQDVPFEKLVEELKPNRDLSRNPVFQVMLILQNMPPTGPKFPDVSVSAFPNNSQSSKFDLLMGASENAGGLRVALEYNTDLFDAVTIERMLGHFENLLEGIVSHPEQRLSELPLLGEEELRRVLVECNDTSTDYPQGLCIHDFVARQAERTPAAAALVCEQQRMTYGELNARANQIAHYLRKRGAGPDVLVGIYCERTADLVVGILGILKSGSAYVPLDPEYPKERLRYILEDAQVPLILTQESLAGELPSFAGRSICLDAEWGEIARESQENPVTQVGPEHLAYVLFTSGSTGRPKGVALEHRAAATFLQWAGGVFTREELAGVLFSTSACFDLSVFEMFVTLSAGGKVILASNALQLPMLPARNEVNLINTVPSALAELVRMGGIPSSVKVVNLAGEALPESLVEQIYATTNVEKVYNLYGPTEATTYSTYTLVRRNDLVTIGKPIANTQVYVLDRHQQPVPFGVPGELYIAGDGVARGYYGRSDLTSERFVPNPFNGNGGARMYRTGDLCRWLPDGNLEYLGRMDQQVKLRGFRIELGEIEATLAQHPGVQACVVVAREDAPGGKRLVAYVVPETRAIPRAEELRQHVKQNLPEFMVPSRIVMLEAFPLTPNGKVDRKALPAPENTRGEGESYVAPKTPVEQGVAAIWSEVLGVPLVGTQDDFFSLGGHSLLVMQVISRLRKKFQIELPLRALFEAPTVAGLGERIEQLQGEEQGLGAPLLKRAGSEANPPLSYAQQRLWFLDQLEPQSAFYNVPYIVRLQGRLRVGVLEKSLDEVVRRHEVLRTRFETVQGEPVQVIDPWRKLAWVIKDLRGLPGEDREAEARRLVVEEAQRPFDLQRGPLLRASLIQLADEDQVLILNIHHIVSDRWSLGVLWEEVAVLYEAAVQGKPSPLEELPVQYADYAIWQREYLSGERLQTQLGYWKQQLEGAPPVLDLPTDRVRPTVESFRGARQSVNLPKELLEGLKELSRQEGVTLFMMMLAAFSVLLSRYSGQEDIVVGSPIAGRNRVEIEKLIGFFVNTLALRTKLSGDPTFRELLGRVREAAVGAYAHQDVPFEKLVEELKPNRDLSRNPVFQVMLILQNMPPTGPKFPDVSVSAFPNNSQSSKFDLLMGASENAGGLRVALEYNTDLFDAVTIERMLGHFENLLEGIVSHPEQRLSELPLLGEEELRRVLVECNDTSTDYPQGLCIHDFVARQAERTPAAAALVCEQQRMTYGELNARANQIAHYLRKRGAGPDVLVGIYCERTADLVVGILGILKSGSAYVPLDPEYPKERLRYILEDAQVPLILTQESLAGELPSFAGRSICLDAEWGEIARESQENPVTQVGPEHLAYVLFTSGSTGRPKGVALEHRAAATFLQWAGGVFTREELAGVLFSTSACFDLSVFEMFVTLSAGGKVILASNALQLPMLPARNEVNLINTVPSALAELVRMGGIPSSVKVVNLAGEALPESLVEQIYATTNVEKVYNLYGPTEATTYSTYTLVRRNDPVTIGKPIANTQVYVLDRHQKPVPLGVPGELYIAGDGVARGYYGRSDLTSERFVPNPFNGNGGARMYRTGDLCRWLPDGNLEYLGRMDQQVKLRGFRIELGEIEATLAQHPGVQACVVVAREDAPGGKRLVAYVVPSAGQDSSSAVLRAYLGQSLPYYMVPAFFVGLNSLPFTANGKINRAALPKPEVTQDDRASTLVPRDHFETVLLGIWERILGVHPIGMTDNFFDLGGYSLLTVRMIFEIKQATGKEIPLMALFQGATIESLAKILNEEMDVMVHQTVTRVQRGGARPPFFAAVTPGVNALEYITLARHMGPDQPFYNLQGPGERVWLRPYSAEEQKGIAAEYVRAMRTVQPQGPYYLGGMCEGAHIAFDMARQLRSEGEEVALLAIFDTWPLENTQNRFFFSIHYYLNRLRTLRRDSAMGRRSLLLNALRRVFRRKSDVSAEWANKYWPGEDFKVPQFDRNITLFRLAKQPYYYVKDRLMGWGKRTNANVQVEIIDGKHLSLLREPHVRDLAGKLSASIERASSETVEVRTPAYELKPGFWRRFATLLGGHPEQL